MKNDQSLFFLTLSLSCIWLVLDNIWGEKYLQTFLANVFPFVLTPEEDAVKRKGKTPEAMQCTECDYIAKDLVDFSEHYMKVHKKFPPGDPLF